MSPVVLHLAAAAASGIEFIDASSQWSQVTTGEASITHTHTLDAGAVAGDTLLWLVGLDGTGVFTVPSGLTQEGTYGVGRHQSYLYTYEIASGDITAGTVARTFTPDPADSENYTVMTVEVKRLSRVTVPVQESKNTSTANVETVSGESLTGVVAGNWLLCICAATTDGGTGAGLSITNARSFTNLGIFPTTVPAGGVTLQWGYLEATAGGTYQGPDYANNSTTGPGNITNPALLELAPA